MKRKGLAVGIILLFMGSCVIPSTAQDIEESPLPTSRGNWLYVGGSGPGNFTSIQDAINASSDNDTVFVYNDSSPYYESIVVEKSIHLQGEDKNTTIIDGSRKGNVITLTAHKVVVTGFTIQNGSNTWNTATIKILSDHNKISNNIITNNILDIPIRNNGVDVIEGESNSIRDNIISKYWDDIYVEGAFYTAIADNIISYAVHGIYITEASYSIIITRNNISNISNNNIYLEDNIEECLIIHNTINNGSEAILIYNCKGTSIIDNDISDAFKAMQIRGGYLTILNNSISRCMNTGIDIEAGSHISIKDNSISGSLVGIRYTESSNGSLNGNKIQGGGIGIQISDPGKNNLVFSNQLKENNVGLYTDLVYKAMSITNNNFINNKIQLSFSQTLLPLRQQTPRNPIFNYNYYTNWKGKGPMMLTGRTLLFVIPFFFPDFPFIIPIYIPCVYFDWNPANAPYYIP